MYSTSDLIGAYIAGILCGVIGLALVVSVSPNGSPKQQHEKCRIEHNVHSCKRVYLPILTKKEN